MIDIPLCWGLHSAEVGWAAVVNEVRLMAYHKSCRSGSCRRAAAFIRNQRLHNRLGFREGEFLDQLDPSVKDIRTGSSKVERVPLKHR